MHKYRKWIIAGILLILLAVLVYAVGWNTVVRLPYFLSGTMDRYLLKIPVGENAKDLILSHCEETFREVVGETECRGYSHDEAAMQNLLPERGTMDHVESANSVVYVWYTLPGDVRVLLAYHDSGWDHTIVNFEKSDWVFVLTQDRFEVSSPWAGLVWW